MKIDLYTKTVLTGILGCLLWLCAMHTPVVTPLQAQLGPTSVIIAGYSSARRHARTRQRTYRSGALVRSEAPRRLRCR